MIFQLIKKKSYEATRYTSPQYDEIGLLIPDSQTSTPLPIFAHIHPANWNEVRQLTQGDLTKAWCKIYTYTTLRTELEGSGGYLADRVEWEGYTYEVRRVKVWEISPTQTVCVAWGARVSLAPDEDID